MKIVFSVENWVEELNILRRTPVGVCIYHFDRGGKKVEPIYIYMYKKKYKIVVHIVFFFKFILGNSRGVLKLTRRPRL